MVAAPAVTEVQRFTAQIASPSLHGTQGAVGATTLPSALLQAGAEAGGAKIFAKITVALSPMKHGPLTVLVNAPPGATETGPSSPSFAGTLEMFGNALSIKSPGTTLSQKRIARPPQR
jgi:tyrosinase